MALTPKQAYALSKKYTADVTKGIELIQGKPCTIKSIEAIGGGKRITYQWTADDGTTKTQTMDVMDGEKGEKGDPGNQGIQGVPGPRGTNGTAATITIGSVTSGESPSVTNVGTQQDAILNFILAKGDKGDKGEKGNDGQNGSSFSIRSRFATYEELIAAFPTGPENEGDAYFVGTTASPDLYIWLVEEQEWHNNGPIAGVKGDKGDQGEEGFSPVANVTKDSNISTITIRDKTGTTTAQVKDGYSPSMSVSKSGDVITVEVTDESGTTEEILDLSGKVNTTDVGTAAYENTTEYVSPLDADIPTSRAVYRAMSSAVYGAYHPSGSKTVSELTSDLLVQANVGNVYKITNSGVTTDLFIEGAGITINAGDNAVVVYASENTFKFDLQSGVVDLSGYQEKELPNGAMIEDVIPSDASASNKLVTENDIYENIGANSSSGGSTIYEISGVKSATRQSGALVLTARAGETIILTLANNVSDNTSASNYSAIRLGGTYKKIQALNYDYTNEKLYVTLGNNSTVECCQLNGAKNDLSITTVSSVPTTNTVSITIKENVTESDFKKGRIVSGLKANANTFTTNVSTWITNGVVRLTVTDSRNAEIYAVYFARVFNSAIKSLHPVVTGYRATLTLNENTIIYDDSIGISSTNDGRVYLEVIENEY